jgi:hypothetical protein
MRLLLFISVFRFPLPHVSGAVNPNTPKTRTRTNFAQPPYHACQPPFLKTLRPGEIDLNQTVRLLAKFYKDAALPGLGEVL